MTWASERRGAQPLGIAGASFCLNDGVDFDGGRRAATCSCIVRARGLFTAVHFIKARRRGRTLDQTMRNGRLGDGPAQRRRSGALPGAACAATASEPHMGGSVGRIRRGVSYDACARRLAEHNAYTDNM